MEVGKGESTQGFVMRMKMSCQLISYIDQAREIGTVKTQCRPFIFLNLLKEVLVTSRHKFRCFWAEIKKFLQNQFTGGGEELQIPVDLTVNL